MGYLREGKAFSKIRGLVDAQTELAAMTSTEFDTTFQHQIMVEKGRLILRVEKGKAWAEVYGF
jgi:hypothetical protein